EAQQLDLAGPGALLLDEARQLGGELLALGEVGPVLDQPDGPGVLVEDLSLALAAGQANLFGLAVDGRELAEGGRECGDRHLGSTDHGAGAAVGPHLATAGQFLAVVDVAAEFADLLRQFRPDDPAPLDDGAVVAVAHHARVGLGAEQQAQAGDDHGLPGTGLAGDRGQSGAGWDGGGLDHSESVQVQFGEHQASGSWGRRQPLTGSASFLTSRVVKGCCASRARCSGVSSAHTWMTSPPPTSALRRPSHQSTPGVSAVGRSIRTCDVGLSTIGRLNSAWAEMGIT